MKRVMVAAFFAVGLVAVGVGVAGINSNWSQHANGSMEVPVRDSQGQAQAIFHLSNDGNELDFKLIASNIEGVARYEHIHCGHAGETGLSSCSCTGSMRLALRRTESSTRGRSRKPT